MAISSVGSYTNSYENLYTYNQTKKVKQARYLR